MSTDPEGVPSTEVPEPSEAPERRWLPVAIAAAIVVIVVVVLVLVLGHGKGAAKATPTSAVPDAYASNLVISKLTMSESENLSGGKVTYLDGIITNQGSQTVTGITAQVLFRSFANQVAQNETQSIKFIRMREPYVDVEPVSAAPLKPSEAHEFRLIFDGVTAEWNGYYPDIRVIHVETR